MPSCHAPTIGKTHNDIQLIESTNDIYTLHIYSTRGSGCGAAAGGASAIAAHQCHQGD